MECTTINIRVKASTVRVRMIAYRVVKFRLVEKLSDFCTREDIFGWNSSLHLRGTRYSEQHKCIHDQELSRSVCISLSNKAEEIRRGRECVFSLSTLGYRRTTDCLIDRICAFEIRLEVDFP
jgi:hypothetical protein